MLFELIWDLCEEDSIVGIICEELSTIRLVYEFDDGWPPPPLHLIQGEGWFEACTYEASNHKLLLGTF